MSKQAIGFILMVAPFVILGILLAIVHYIEGWKRAIRKYRNFADNFELICMSISTIFWIMFFTGLYFVLF